ncbi:CheB methylesterase domain-containing protein [Yoonia litorea]|uniref:protein-glutamate methylesterase n=1 Tax=Yoonia litorea TaxID=1123755 RepID=A0A1I6MIK0_9RHOB|nr:CheB methylesterase domain-containing protein [Yoonia litorea]SFS15438.1 CheB methylesterase [Yoonia litorea]
MTKKILICHKSPNASRQLRDSIKEAIPEARLNHVGTLTEAYNLVEHRLPDALILQEELARQPEAELLFALARLTEVRAVIATDRDSQPVCETLVAYPRLSLTSGSDDIARILRCVRRTSESQILSKHETVSNNYDPEKIILIGASTGGIDALMRVLSHWTATCPPTLIVQHTGASHLNSLAGLLNRACDARVHLATDGESLQTGCVYLAPGGSAHLCLTPEKRRLRLDPAPPVSGHRPSIDALFHSARPYAEHVAAALLTGMGRDGAQGILALREAGALTFGQDRATSVVYGMPRVAKEIGGIGQEHPIDKIGPALLAASQRKRSAA